MVSENYRDNSKQGNLFVSLPYVGSNIEKVKKMSDGEIRNRNLNDILFCRESWLKDVDGELSDAIRQRKLPEGYDSEKFEDFYLREYGRVVFPDRGDFYHGEVAPRGFNGRLCDRSYFEEDFNPDFKIIGETELRKYLMGKFSEESEEIKRAGNFKDKYRIFRIPGEEKGYVALNPTHKEGTYIVKDLELLKLTKTQIYENEDVVRIYLPGILEEEKMPKYFERICEGHDLLKERYLRMCEIGNVCGERDADGIRMSCLEKLGMLDDTLEVTEVSRLLNLNPQGFRTVISRNREFFSSGSVKIGKKIFLEKSLVEELLRRSDFVRKYWKWFVRE